MSTQNHPSAAAPAPTTPTAAAPEAPAEAAPAPAAPQDAPPTTRADAPAPPPLGLILFAHGARDPQWARPFEQVAQAVRAARPQWAVTLAFLEFMAPDLPSAGDYLSEVGCRQVVVLPLFLGVGGHVRHDLPRLLEALQQRHPQVHWSLAPPIGEDTRLVQALAAIALDWGERVPPYAPQL
ncbi:sirohydrochlorin chelatase [Tepidimonas charontis]|uniref:Sirohydrochlorin ferrochelatase n=1 Tax=Tepidimonas charontis TaxID=2267262 RepID=A0A554XDJ8_9BURK|nr:CbiX/SirB N-terminal domain-containing protein [Tepidimonas charontis]TSE33911.1 Sirohydrochlorin ferrochelatase [Tepidimonas charontis]